MSQSIEQIAMKLGKYIPAAQRMNSVNFGDHMTFPLVPGQNVQNPFYDYLAHTNGYQSK